MLIAINLEKLLNAILLNAILFNAIYRDRRTGQAPSAVAARIALVKQYRAVA